MTALRTLVAIDASTDRDTVEAVLPVEPRLELVDLVEGLDESWQALQQEAVDLLLVACGDESDHALSFVEGVVRHYPDRPVIVLHRGAANGVVSRAFAAGAEDIVTVAAPNGHLLAPPERERSAADLLLALEKMIARRQRARVVTRATPGRMITVLGPKGGAGKTLTSCSLGITLAEAGKRAVLVDLDLQFGDVALALGIPPGKTIYDLARSGGSLDAEKLSAYLATHESGLQVLMAPARPDHATSIEVEFLRGLFDVLRGSHDRVIVDTPPGFTPEVIAAVDASTDICMVGMLDSLSLKNTKLGLETLDLKGVDPRRVKLLLNRADSRVGITREDVQAVTGRPPDVLVPSHRDIPRSINEARPIVRSQPRSDAARALRSLGEGFLDAGARSRPRRRGLFGRRG
jgi:pilus assembly protein CpaE